jgi:hypothetical protein
LGRAMLFSPEGECNSKRISHLAALLLPTTYQIRVAAHLTS